MNLLRYRPGLSQGLRPLRDPNVPEDGDEGGE